MFTVRDRRSAPLWGLRLGTLLLAWAWAIVAGSVGLNALIKSNQQQSALRKQVPAGTVLQIDVSDVFKTGVIVTTICATIALLTTILLYLLLRRPLLLSSPGALKIQGAVLTFLTIWLFAVQVPFTHFFRTRSAGVRAFINGQELPASIVQSVERGLGSTSVYKRISYLRLVAILPWFAILFTLIASIVLFKAASRARRASASAVSPTSPTETRGTNSGEGMVEKDRGVSTEKERVVESEKAAEA